MTKFLSYLLILLTATNGFSATSPNVIPLDVLKLGKQSSSGDKALEFQQGLGAANAKIKSNRSANDIQIVTPDLKFGDGSSADQVFTFNSGLGSANAKMRWSLTNHRLEFANDGSTFKALGSGGGGAAGINLLADNGDFEAGTNGWTNTGGTFAIVTTGSPNLLVGDKSGVFTASATSQSIQSALQTIPKGLKGVSSGCIASMLYQGGGPNLTFEVVDNTPAVVVSQALVASATPRTISLPFDCSKYTSVQLKIVSTGAEAALAMDQMYLGQNTLVALSQANKVGSVNYVEGNANCVWSQIAASWQDFPAITGCGAPVSSGSLQGHAANANPGFTIPNAPPGEYMIVVEQESTFNGSSALISQRLVEATTNTIVHTWGGAVPKTSTDQSYTTSFTNGSTQTLDFKMQGFGDGTFSAYVDARTYPVTFTVYRFPTQQDHGVRPETINWYIDARQGGGSGCAFGTPGPYSCGTSMSISPPDPTRATTAYGQACAGAVASVLGQYNCGGGGSAAGLTINVPAPQDIEVCMDGAIYNSSNTANDIVLLRLDEVGNSNDSPIQYGNSTLDMESNTGAANSRSRQIHVCSSFKASQGQHTYKIINLPGIASNLGILADSTLVSDRNIRWTAHPITQTIPAPVLVGANAQSNAPNGIQIENVAFGGPGTFTAPTDCADTANCTVYSSTSTWYSSIVGNTAGAILTVPPGTWGSIPVCTCSVMNDAQACSTRWDSATSLRVVSYRIPSPGYVTGSFQVNCIGKK